MDFKPDADVEYTAVHEIDLANVGSFIARYPKPDDVVPVTERRGNGAKWMFYWGLHYHRRRSDPRAVTHRQKQTKQRKLYKTGGKNTAILQRKVQRIGDFIDMDAVRVYFLLMFGEVSELTVVFQLATAEFLINIGNNRNAGICCLVHTDPQFCEQAKQGFNVVVGGKGFGCESSREQAVMALLSKSNPTTILSIGIRDF
ncbi:Aconitase/3-isopropylmalate dehydratase large subunit, alpha/beta/alpha [Penicillium expansum]|uniref:Aconitase/3-isopropylmalate dehydratase large subunit, alpha/beta/alpha n=1 Tax=Penicillium expansum TaxID=27334 RepID=A0A0A2IHP8_PENEN|nr:Aconitase/3-isopropylmalate dehydratase large subunit, alpha/beta/alpha [Penicillium expansum]KGO41963.1 Aconitase/3-isopropylmalate dehydratase large subunit, alpha/beta/alpha [Penicillium expansum]KGO55292.1 Aconitase/3-isopropylmalate dehydratase large subunit, alpha/beta/alpha [Penicillium expansum]KGO72027.1 Aconitase/3-isopropylmalate dehydratase large subunit, alpha/beta/alpha [Penicillium expansum]